jgi:hypothetical protein
VKAKMVQFGFSSKTTPLLFVYSCILCGVPLFNLLGFEFCFASGLALSLIHGIFSAALSQRQSNPIMTQWQMSLQKLLGPCLALLIPIIFNGLFVQNCNWLAGARWFFLIVVCSGIVASGVGVLCGRFDRFPRGLFILFWLSAILVGVARFIWTPQVDVFNLVAGYFPGALYDEVLAEETRIFWSRCEDVSIIWMLLASVAVVRKEIRYRTAALAFATLLLASFQAQSLDLRRSSAHVQTQLGGLKNTTHFALYYPKGWSDERIDGLSAELEFLYQELKRDLSVVPNTKLEIYFYKSMHQKKRLMGARKTRIAKPWQNAFHIDAPQIGSSVLRHELIHLFADDFGAPPLGIAQNQYGLPNMALTEGLAEAYSPRDPRLSLHEWTAALDRINKRPDIRQLLTPSGFYASSARSAYTVCGSLLRFTAKHHGLDVVKRWYQEGEWTGPVPLETLIEQWEHFLGAVPIEAPAIAAARSHFDRPSIFKRVCAHEISSIREDIRRAIASRNTEDVFKRIDALLSHSPRDRWGRMRRLEQLAIDHQLVKAKEQAQSLATDSKAGQATRDIAQEWLADIEVLNDQFGDAQVTYQALRDRTFNRSAIRRLEVKLYAVQNQSRAKALIEFLSFSRDRSKAKHRVERLYRQFPTDQMVRYLRARHLFSHKHYLSAHQMLLDLRGQSLPTPIRLEIDRLLVIIGFREHCYVSAQAQYEGIVDAYASILTAGEIDQFRSWSRRAKFFADSSLMKQYSCPLEIDNPIKPNHDVLQQE